MSLAKLIDDARDALLQEATASPAPPAPRQPDLREPDLGDLRALLADLCSSLGRGPTGEALGPDGLGERLVGLHRLILGRARAAGYRLSAPEQRALLDALLRAATEAGKVDGRKQHDQREALEQYAFIAHDLRGVVNTANLALAVLRRKAPPETPGLPPLIRALDEISRRLRDAVAAWRVFRGLGRPEPTRVEVARLINEVLEEVRVQADRVPVGLRAEVPEGMALSADRGLLRVALRNVVHNAIRYSPAGVEVIVRALSEDDHLALEVIDSCLGFPASPPRRGGWSMGLGLKIADAIAQAHGGRLTRDDGQRAGCVFRLVLPATKVA